MTRCEPREEAVVIEGRLRSEYAYWQGSFFMMTSVSMRMAPISLFKTH
jgi:hypothetical protein